MTLIFLCLGYYLLAGFCVSVGYHRLLTHRSFETYHWLKYALVTCALPAGTPVQWVGNHRCHHAHTDQEEDPHSPHNKGFWYAHVGWYIQSDNRLLCLLYAFAGPARMLFDAWHRPRSNQEHNQHAKDVQADKYLSWLSKELPYLLVNCIHCIGMLIIFIAAGGLLGALLYWLTLICIYNFGDLIDSAAHLWGERPWECSDQSANHRFLALVTFGEGWHANHHRYPRSAQIGFRRGELDPGWLCIKLLSLLGLAWNIKLIPSFHQHHEISFQRAA